MRISDWSSDVCSSDLCDRHRHRALWLAFRRRRLRRGRARCDCERGKRGDGHMMRLLTRLARSSSGATAAEFAMVLPLLLIFLLGIIDVGRLMWTWNRAEKATQMGVRFAVVADMVPGNLDAYDFALQIGRA